MFRVFCIFCMTAYVFLVSHVGEEKIRLLPCESNKVLARTQKAGGTRLAQLAYRRRGRRCNGVASLFRVGTERGHLISSCFVAGTLTSRVLARLRSDLLLRSAEVQVQAVRRVPLYFGLRSLLPLIDNRRKTGDIYMVAW